jgi:hypothetical protein
MSESRPDFRAIKARVGMREVLRKYGVELRRLNGTTGRGKCPLPTHDPEATEDTFHVDFGKNVWACHSASCVAGRKTKKEGGAPKKGGDVLEFVKFMEKAVSLRVAGEKLEAWFGPFVDRPEAPGIPSEFEMSTYPEGDINKPLTFVLKDPNPKDPYLQTRGFDEEECEYLGVGYFRGKGMMAECIVFPIHNENGELIAYAGRATDRDIPHGRRWRLPPGFMKTRAHYNLHRVQDSEVIVVESFWGVLACVRAGIMNAVSIMGTSISDWQAATLAARFKRVIVMFDGDEYGREAVSAAVNALVMAEVEHIDLVLLPKGEQPDTLTPDALRLQLRMADMPSAWSLVEELVPETA